MIEEIEKLKKDLESANSEIDRLKCERDDLLETAAEQKTASEVAAAMQKRVDAAEAERDKARAEVEDLRKTVTQILNGGANKPPDRDGFMKSLNL